MSCELRDPVKRSIVEDGARGLLQHPGSLDAKLAFYAAHGVDELVIVDPQAHRVEWLGLVGGTHEPVQASRLIELGRAELTARIDWP